MHMGLRCFKVEQQDVDKQVKIGPSCSKGGKHSTLLLDKPLSSGEHKRFPLLIHSWSVIFQGTVIFNFDR